MSDVTTAAPQVRMITVEVAVITVEVAVVNVSSNN